MSHRLKTDHLLPDVIDPNIRLLFVGLAPSHSSVNTGHYYADENDHFYRLVHQATLTSERLTPEKDNELLSYKIGLTHLSKIKSINTAEDLSPADLSMGRLVRLIFKYQPHIVCFNGLHTFREFFDRERDYGLQRERIGNAHVFVVPATHGNNDYGVQLKYFKQLKLTITGDCP